MNESAKILIAGDDKELRCLLVDRVKAYGFTPVPALALPVLRALST